MKLYDFQQECIDVMSKNNVGKIILPTGTGKSTIEFEYAKSKMNRLDNEHQIVVIVAPRIILCQQLIRGFSDFLISKYNNVQEIFTFVSSGKFPSIRINNKYLPGKYTTNIKEIAHDIRLAKKHNRDNIIFSTYKSFSRCVDGIKDAVGDGSKVYLLADEAHYFTRKYNDDGIGSPFNALKNNLSLFNSRFFFTATPRYSDSDIETGSSMNNEDIFGKEIYIKQPRYFINRGIICEPRIHDINFENEISDDTFGSVAGDFILKAFDKHQEIVRKNCGDLELRDRIGAKVLVAVKGSTQLKQLLDNGFIKKATDKNINVVWTMSHKDIGAGSQEAEDDSDNEDDVSLAIGAEKLKIAEFLSKIKELGQDDEKKIIVLHYNQLTEGIDIPSMTGLIVLRGMLKDRAVQSIGRVLRVHPGDRGKDTSNKSNWIKPYSYIIIPGLEETNDFNNIVVYLRDDYSADIKVEMEDSAIGLDKVQPDMQNKKEKNAEFRFINGELIHEIEGLKKRFDDNLYNGIVDVL